MNQQMEQRLFVIDSGIVANQRRIATMRDYIERLQGKQAAGKPLCHTSEYVHQQIVKVGRLFFVWDALSMSPHEHIARSQARINELKRKRATELEFMALS